MSQEGLQPGLRHSATLTVDGTLIVPSLPRALPGMADMPAVFATAYLVAFVEATCIEAMQPHLAPGLRSVGTGVDMTHTAATPVGFRVTAEVELVEVEGRRLKWRVECRDDAEVIGAGFHERFIIDLAKFNGRVEAKARKSA